MRASTLPDGSVEIHFGEDGANLGLKMKYVCITALSRGGFRFTVHRGKQVAHLWPRQKAMTIINDDGSWHSYKADPTGELWEVVRTKVPS